MSVLPPISMRPFRASADAFAAGSDSPRAFLERCLEAIAAGESDIRAFVTFDQERARRAADAATARWRSGRPLSPIDGMPFGVKDIIETRDFPTEMGSPLFRGWCSGRDAAAVAALRAAGAVVLGKTVTAEFAGLHPGPTRNPHDIARTPGGSSSGSAAAVAAGMVSTALGTQLGGSIVRPASYCGCFGFKPSLGALNRGGSHDFFSQSCMGVLAADLDDAWHVVRCISKSVGGDPGHVGLSGPSERPLPRRPAKLIVLETAGWRRASPEAVAAFDAACEILADAGLVLARRADDPQIEAFERSIEGLSEITGIINDWEAKFPLGGYRQTDPDKLSAIVFEQLQHADTISPADYAEALADRERVRAGYAQLAGRYDGAVTLSAPDCAPLGIESTGDPIFAQPASALGVPALSLPLLMASGLPLGLQIIGFSGGDADLFAVAGFALETIGRARRRGIV